jgi:hypothetical protein
MTKEELDSIPTYKHFKYKGYNIYNPLNNPLNLPFKYVRENKSDSNKDNNPINPINPGADWLLYSNFNRRDTNLYKQAITASGEGSKYRIVYKANYLIAGRWIDLNGSFSLWRKPDADINKLSQILMA